MQFAICNEIFEGWKLSDAMAFAAKTGYDAIEIAPFTIAPYVTEISDTQRKEIRQLAKDNGISISGIHWVLAKTEGLHLTHPDKAVREKTAKYMAQLVDFCADIGGHIMVVGSPKQRSLVEGVTPEQATAYARECFGPAVSLALNRGLTICLEPLAPSETNFINTAEEAIRFIKYFRSPSFRIILDVKAMCSESKPIPQIIKDSWPSFAYFHANDKNLKGPGFGDVDYRPIVAALKETGFDRTVSVEVFNFDEGPEVIATKSLAYLKEVFGAAPQPSS